MRELGVFVQYKKKYKVTTNSNHKQPVFDNALNRKFQVNKPNHAYVSDMTYIPSHEGWLYLTVVIDLFSRKVVGWNMSSRMKADTVRCINNGHLAEKAKSRPCGQHEQKRWLLGQ